MREHKEDERFQVAPDMEAGGSYTQATTERKEKGAAEEQHRVEKEEEMRREEQVDEQCQEERPKEQSREGERRG